MNTKKSLRELQQVTKKYVREGIKPADAAMLIEDLLEQEWVKKLLVFSNQAFMITDNLTMKYLYVSPSIENITGYPASEFPDVFSLAHKNILSPEEIALLPTQKEIAMRTLAETKFPINELYKIRYSRNNWFTHKNGTRRNGLQHSMGLAFDDSGMILLELLILIDVTDFNDSPHHFYKLTKVEDDGSEEVLSQGTLEETEATPREREILALVATGATSDEIAARLHISTETVKVHRKKLLEKTNSASSIDLLRYGFAQGWL